MHHEFKARADSRMKYAVIRLYLDEYGVTRYGPEVAKASQMQLSVKSKSIKLSGVIKSPEPADLEGRPMNLDTDELLPTVEAEKIKAPKINEDKFRDWSKDGWLTDDQGNPLPGNHQ